ncbi:HK97 gp10 family phage protein [Caproiciproducens sp. NJN-50]|uniref:HK97 gp10 family phage protein n=1 Tax=Caproiciproducens galactitolivorans TaxID=642589 RepID=A0ABT4BT14_9FIRM|nr:MULTISPECIES: HK97-gp10 family putative phage morphogenesis protein [Caproiciproducens]MCY1714039.1 HK97 gp10 family phage protein [Caproiciproducens galactitolivorans]QAT49542.1 HK97 gp10 family phage protein [Caproiciproducens sp. NJN-50]
MAKVNFKMPDDFLRKVSALGEKTDEIIPRVLEAGGEVALEKVRDNLREAVGRDTKFPSRSTGELEAALGLSPAKMDKNGNFNVKVGFSEPRSDGESNAKIANILEYGKHGQPPKPFLQPAKTQARKPGIEAMKQKLEEEIGGL